jgi:hypothetical protein
MPVKFKSSEALVDRNTRKKTIKNYYMQATKTEDLVAAVANDNTRGPRRQKIRNELVRRGVEL